MKKLMKIVAIVFVGLVGVGILSAIGGSYGLGEVTSLTIAPVDIARLADGEYAGAYAKSRWRYNLAVRIDDGRMVSIRLLDDKMASYGNMNTQLIDSVLSKQDIGLSIDAYTSASAHGKAFLKAVETALSTAPSRDTAAAQSSL